MPILSPTNQNMLLSPIFALSLLFSGYTPTPPAPHGTASILVRVSDFRKNSGKLLIALYDGSTPFLSETELPAGFAADIKNGKSEKLLTNLPAGEYAISVMHDENGNKRMDYNALGIPVEGYGLSNNVRLYFSKPAYKSCTFLIKEGQMKTVDITMKYFL
jgi:uncharacterized protein (DUF2141 family)